MKTWISSDGEGYICAYWLFNNSRFGIDYDPDSKSLFWWYVGKNEDGELEMENGDFPEELVKAIKTDNYSGNLQGIE